MSGQPSRIRPRGGSGAAEGLLEVRGGRFRGNDHDGAGRARRDGVHDGAVIVSKAQVRAGAGLNFNVVGSLRRGDYGIDAWQIAVRERVRFVLRVRLGQEAG